MPEFDLTGPVTVSLRLHRGSADVIAEDRTTARVDVIAPDGTDASAHLTIALEGGTLIVHAPDAAGWGWRRTPGAHVTVRVPLDSTVAARSAAADLRLAGRYSTVHASLSSAHVRLEHATGDARLKSASGNVLADRVDGSLRLNSASGALWAGDVTGDVNASTASGNITVARAGGSVSARTASGTVEIGVMTRGRADLATMSGDVVVGVTPGTGVWLDLSTATGSTSSDLAMGDAPAEGRAAATLELRVRTASGNIDVHRALTLPAVA
ncbi:DUF4097 family beta strand repeat-containing protein [Pseudosporangium ferrugineum]|uniref:Putative adhesin n=1 Tax=Pseudosporangium ferrugineum TaxID=439699 RepID=A0A2T0SJL5_9ACTN|nr:DUF4097 family beta strand repeat-containing protein [Pseudosporangium ferrugineum]PRY33607.1 putative adhesin [Pseudosporangium ferrugineum]